MKFKVLIVDDEENIRGLLKNLIEDFAEVFEADTGKKGFYIFGPADGDYGLMTELAVKEFQLYHGLKPTGSADAATLRLLNFHVFDPGQS